MTDVSERVIVYADRTDIAPGERFSSAGVEYVAVTGSIGYHVEPVPGVRVPAGMINDPVYPLPDNAIMAVPWKGEQ